MKGSLEINPLLYRRANRHLFNTPAANIDEVAGRGLSMPIGHYRTPSEEEDLDREDFENAPLYGHWAAMAGVILLGIFGAFLIFMSFVNFPYNAIYLIPGAIVLIATVFLFRIVHQGRRAAETEVLRRRREY
jgi:hypothetical protein